MSPRRLSPGFFFPFDADLKELGGYETFIFNPGFEAGDVQWTKEAGWTIVQDISNARSGSWVGTFTNTVSGALRGTKQFQVLPGQKFYIEGWVKGGTAGQCSIRISWRNAAGAEISVGNGNLVNFGATVYTQSSATVVAPAGAFLAQVEFAAVNGPAGTWYVDDAACSRSVAIINDVGVDVSTLRPNGAKFGGYAAVEQGITNLNLQNDFNTILGGWNATNGQRPQDVTTQVGGWRRVPKVDGLGATNQEIFMNTGYAVTAGTRYTETVLVRTDGTDGVLLGSLQVTFFTNNGHHAIVATVIDLGGGLFRVSATYVIEALGTSLRSIDLINFSWGNATYLDILEPVTFAHAGVALDVVDPIYSSHVWGTRAAGLLKYPGSVFQRAVGSVSCWVRPNYDWRTYRNELNNSSFENGLTGWTVYNNGPEGATIAQVASPFHGAQAAKVSWTVANTSTKGIMSVGVGGAHYDCPWKPNTTYVISWYAKATTAIASGMSTYWNIAPAAIVALANPNLTTAYQRYAFQITTAASPETLGQLFISIINGGGQAANDLFIDAVMVSEGSTLDTYFPRQDHGVVTQTTTDQSDQAQIVVKGGSLTLEVFTGGTIGFSLRWLPPSWDPGKLHHIVVTWSDTEQVLYYNGIRQATRSGAFTRWSPATWMTVGTASSPASANAWLEGGIDDLAVLDRQLTDAQIAAIFGLGAPFLGESSIGIEAAAQAEFVHLLELLFSGGATRLNTGAVNLSWNGFTWNAVGGNLQIGNVEESPDASGQGVEVSLSGVDQSIVATLLTSSFRGRKIRIWRAYLDMVAGVVQVDPVLLLEGLQLDPYEVTEERSRAGGAVTIKTRIRGRMGVDRIRGIWTNVTSHQHYYAGDTFFQNAAALGNTPIYWGTAIPISPGGGGSQQPHSDAGGGDQFIPG